jgi:hypothetical protein
MQSSWGTDKLKAVKDAKPPENVKQIHQYLGLCNFFRGHIQNFVQVTAHKSHKKGFGLETGVANPNMLCEHSDICNLCFARSWC